jgi:hypothetical protein
MVISVVATSTTNMAVNSSPQRKVFYAAGRYWVFYYDGSKIVYRTSSNGENWSDAVTIKSLAVGEGIAISVVFDGTYVHYAYAYASDLVYRMGTPESDGTITWKAAEQTVYVGSCAVPAICIDSDGYPWIGFRVKAGTETYGTPYVTKSKTKDGTWTDDTGFPHHLRTDDLEYWAEIPVALTNSKIYVVYASHGGTLYGKLYDGGWGSEETISTRSMRFHRITAVAYGDDVYVAWLTWVEPHPGIYVNTRTYGVGWGSDEILSASDDTYHHISLNVNPVNGKVNLFYGYSDGVYFTSHDVNGWKAPRLLIPDSEISKWGGPTVAYDQLGSYTTLLVWVTGTSSPYNIKFTAFALLPSSLKSNSHTL